MMNLIVETDLGHDPDDFFAICYLIAAGVNIKCVTITPGGPDQVAVASLIRKITGAKFSIGVAQPNRNETGVAGIHKELLKYYNCPRTELADGTGEGCVRYAIFDGNGVNHVEALVIGPPKSIGQYLLSPRPKHFIDRITVQGGFLAYHHHNFPCLRLPKFEGASWCPTFNLNGDRKGAVAIAESKVPHIQYVCKNVCHTVEFNMDRFLATVRKPESSAEELFQKAAEFYFDKHDSKKFHDPTAAVCHLHPEIASWVKGRMVKIEGGWGGIPDSTGHDIIADIDYDSLWNRLGAFN